MTSARHCEGRTTEIARSTVLPATPAVAFAAVNSPSTAPLIDPAVRVWRPDTEPIDVGTRFTIRARLGGMPFRGTSETIAWEPPHLASYRSVSPTWPIHVTAHHRFEPRGEQTLYTWSMTFHEVNVIGRPLIALGARLFERAMAQQAEALTAYLSQEE